MNKIGNFLKSFDLIATKPSIRLHFDGDQNHKTSLGGFCTFLAFICFLSVAILSAKSIYDKENTYFSQTVEKFEYYDKETGKINKMSLKNRFKILFEIGDFSG